MTRACAAIAQKQAALLALVPHITSLETLDKLKTAQELLDKALARYQGGADALTKRTGVATSLSRRIHGRVIGDDEVRSLGVCGCSFPYLYALTPRWLCDRARCCRHHGCPDPRLRQPSATQQSVCHLPPRQRELHQRDASP